MRFIGNFDGSLNFISSHTIREETRETSQQMVRIFTRTFC